MTLRKLLKLKKTLKDEQTKYYAIVRNSPDPECTDKVWATYQKKVDKQQAVVDKILNTKI